MGVSLWGAESWALSAGGAIAGILVEVLSRMHAISLRFRRLSGARLHHVRVRECAKEGNGYEWPNLEGRAAGGWVWT